MRSRALPGAAEGGGGGNGDIRVRPFPSSRRLVTGAQRAGRRRAPMHGLLEFDVTDARRLLAATDPPQSFTAFVLACVGKAASKHPQVHAYRNWRGQLVQHGHVDATALVEVSTPQGPFPLAHVIRNVDARTVADLTAELRAVKADDRESTSGRLLARYVGAVTWIPGLLPAMYMVMNHSVRARRKIGTVAVSAVGMFGGGAGFGIAPLALMPLQIIVGGISPRPRVIAGTIEVRDLVDLTVSIDHNIVDGAPAARFCADLRSLIEGADLLRTAL